MVRRDILGGNGAQILIEYRDAEGVDTVREVVPRYVIGDQSARGIFNVTHLEAYCLLRRGNRTFRMERIRSVSDPKTGELFAPGSWLAAQQYGELRDLNDIEGDQDKRNSGLSENRRTSWKVWALVIVAAYMIGRLRVLPWILHVAGQTWGRWL